MRNYILAMLAVLLIACAPVAEEAPAPAPVPLPEPETTPEQPDDELVDAPPVESGSGETAFIDELTAPTTDEMINEDDVICNAEERALQFRFRNTADFSMELNQDVPFPAPAELKGVRILFNNYEVNGRGAFIAGERMFGPSETFSENCGGVSVLAPGEEVTCFVQPVPVRLVETLGENANEIVLNTAGADGRVKFDCN